MKKAQVFDQVARFLPSITIFLVLFGAVGPTMAAILNSEDPEYTATLDSFDNLIEQINQLLEQKGAYNSVENIPVYIGPKYAIVGFDNNSDTYSLVDTDVSVYDGDNTLTSSVSKVQKPLLCGSESCLCLYSRKKGKSSEEDYFDDIFETKKCEQLTSSLKISYYSKEEEFNTYHYFVREDKPSKKTMQTIKCSSVNGIERLLGQQEKCIKSKTENLNQGFLNKYWIAFPKNSYAFIRNNPRNYFYLSLFGEFAKEPLETYEKFNSFTTYGVKIINLHLLNMSFFKSSNVGEDKYKNTNFLILSNEEIPHSYAWDKYKLKDHVEYRQKILSSNNNLNKLILFKEYYEYSSLDVLKNVEFKTQMEKIGDSVLYEVYLALIDEDIVEGIPETASYKLKLTEESCKSGNIINEKSCSEFINKYKNKKIQELYTNVTETLKEINPDRFKELQLSLAEKLFDENKYTDSFNLYIGYLESKYTIGESVKDVNQNDVVLSYEKDNYFWQLLSEDPELSILREPLRIFHYSSDTINYIDSSYKFYIDSLDVPNYEILFQPNYTYNNVTHQFNYDMNNVETKYVNLNTIRADLESNKEKIFTSIALYQKLIANNAYKNIFDENLNYDNYLVKAGTS